MLTTVRCSAGDGVYSYVVDDSIVLEDVAKKTTRVLVKGEDITGVRSLTARTWEFEG